MRTTLNIDDDVLEMARAAANQSGRSLGRVVSDLIRKGLAPRQTREADYGIPTFDVPRGAPPIPASRAEELLADEGVDGRD